MTPQCPKCNAELKDEYGMQSCASCSFLVFVDMDGNAFAGESQGPGEDSPMEVLPPEPKEESEEPAPYAEQPLDSADYANPLDAFAEPEPAPESESVSAPDGGFAPLEPDAELNMDVLLGFQGAPAESPAPVEEFGKPGDPLGVNDFANSEMSQAKDGPLLYRVRISGIDSKEIRESLREAIEDARFAWEPQALLSKINKGSLLFDNLAPVKAVILVNRLKRLPIEIRWEQYAITQAEDL